jgi:amylosucrase
MQVEPNDESQRWVDGLAALTQVYGELAVSVAQRAKAIALAAASARPAELRELDQRRLAEPDWFLKPTMVGYVAYADRFAGSLAAVADHLDYLDELGVTYLHLMPLLRPREGENDGGYAVSSYDEVDPSLGTMDDLESVARSLRARGISLCIDLVLNHTSSDHDWALQALAGDPIYREFYRFFPDRTMPDRYEQTLREVFPDFAPGNFSQVGTEWVWTTFNEFQWDLNYANPDVFCAMLEVICRLANRGVEVFRLDAVAFLWKRLGTDCENQPEAHHLLTALRAFVAMAAPAAVFKAEAIVSPDLLVPYLGQGEPTRRECELAYNNQLMVMLWSSLATRDGLLMSKALARMIDNPAGTSWVTYVRCHDDIGWAVTDADAGAVGWDGWSHRRFLSSFYDGTFDGSFARGELFQNNPATGDSRISGSAASLCGIEDALERHDAEALAAAVCRLDLIYAFAFAYGGIPLIYMGDELGLLNDHSYLYDPDHAADNRWIHRPTMQWALAAERSVATSLRHRVFSNMRALVLARGAQPALHGNGRTRMVPLADRRLAAFTRHAPSGEIFVMIANVSDDHVSLARTDVPGVARLVHSGGGATISLNTVSLPPRSYMWLVGPASAASAASAA